MASLAPHRNSSIALRYIEATSGLFDDQGLTRLPKLPSGNASRQPSGIRFGITKYVRCKYIPHCVIRTATDLIRQVYECSPLKVVSIYL